MPTPYNVQPYQDKGFCEARVHKDFRRNPDGNIKKLQEEKHGSPQVSNTSLPPINALFGIHHNNLPMTPIQDAHSLNHVMVPHSDVGNLPKIGMNLSIPLGGDYRFVNQPNVSLYAGNVFQFKPKKSRVNWTKKLDNLVKSIPCLTTAKPEEFSRVSKNRVVPNHLSFYQPSPFEHFMPMFAPGIGYQQNDPLFKIPHLPFNINGFEVPTPEFFDIAQVPSFDYPSVEEKPVNTPPPPAEEPIEVEEEEEEMTVEEIIASLDSISSYGSKPSDPSSSPKSHPTDPHLPFSQSFEF